MPIRVSPEKFELLQQIAEAERQGRPLRDVADERQVARGTITYQLNSIGFKTELWVVDARTGERLSDLLARGEIVADPGHEMPAAAGACSEVAA